MDDEILDKLRRFLEREQVRLGLSAALATAVGGTATGVQLWIGGAAGIAETWALAAGCGTAVLCAANLKAHNGRVIENGAAGEDDEHPVIRDEGDGGNAPRKTLGARFGHTTIAASAVTAALMVWSGNLPGSACVAIAAAMTAFVMQDARLEQLSREAKANVTRELERADNAIHRARKSQGKSPVPRISAITAEKNDRAEITGISARAGTGEGPPITLTVDVEKIWLLGLSGARVRLTLGPSTHEGEAAHLALYDGSGVWWMGGPYRVHERGLNPTYTLGKKAGPQVLRCIGQGRVLVSNGSRTCEIDLADTDRWAVAAFARKHAPGDAGDIEPDLDDEA